MVIKRMDVTGGAGLTRRHVLKLLLSKGHEVRILARNQPDPSMGLSDPMMLAEDIVALGPGWEIAFDPKPLDPIHGQQTKILLKRPAHAQDVPASFVVEKQRGH